MMKVALFCSVLLLVFAGGWARRRPNIFNGAGCESNQLFQKHFKPQIDAIAPDVKRILDYVLSPQQSGKTHASLTHFVDRFGARFTGTENLENAIDYMLTRLKKEKHENVHGENVTVPKWTRGDEWAVMVKPRHKKLGILGLGYSVGTDGRVIEAPVIVVRSFAELERRAAEVKGKIVVYNFRFKSYFLTKDYREKGAARAAKLGAVASFTRSLTPFSIGSPHTGMLSYDDGVPKIPGASISVEDAELLQRLTDRKRQVIVRLYSENYLEEEKVISRNVISELVGTEYPKQVVLVSGHIDSWDVGQGAMDDGAGAFISWRALSILKQLGLKPKRTLRSVLWTAEEMGLLGATEYAKRHRDEMKDHSIAMESDEGTFTPMGMSYSGTNKTAHCILYSILQLMAPINATDLSLRVDGSDIMMLKEEGVPVSSLDTHNEKYFYFHHTEGDTMTVESREELDKCQAMWTAVSYALASIDQVLPDDRTSDH